MSLTGFSILKNVASDKRHDASLGFDPKALNGAVSSLTAVLNGLDALTGATGVRMHTYIYRIPEFRHL